jgi:hypothetical protein
MEHFVLFPWPPSSPNLLAEPQTHPLSEECDSRTELCVLFQAQASTLAMSLLGSLHGGEGLPSPPPVRLQSLEGAAVKDSVPHPLNQALHRSFRVLLTWAWGVGHCAGTGAG